MALSDATHPADLGIFRDPGFVQVPTQSGSAQYPSLHKGRMTFLNVACPHHILSLLVALCTTKQMLGVKYLLHMQVKPLLFIPMAPITKWTLEVLLQYSPVLAAAAPTPAVRALFESYSRPQVCFQSLL